MELLKVSARSSPNSVAGAMAGAVRQSGAVDVQVVGAGALNQAIKALVVARGFVRDSGLDLVCAPAFADVLIDGEHRTAIKLQIEGRPADDPDPDGRPTASSETAAVVDMVSAAPLGPG